MFFDYLGLMQLRGANDEVLSFSALERLEHLETLDLELLHMKDLALRPLANMSRLSHLSLRTSSLTDESLYHTSSAKKLVHLSIQGTMLTDTGLAAFAPPPALEILDLRGCWLLSQEIVSRFCQKHPQLEVRHNSFETLPSRATTRTPKGKNRQGSSSAPPQYFVVGEFS